MFGCAFDEARPLPLSFRQVGRGDQFAQRQDAIERRADFMRQHGEGGLDRSGTRGRTARARRLAPPLPGGFRTPDFTHATSQPAYRMPRAAPTGQSAQAPMSDYGPDDVAAAA